MGACGRVAALVVVLLASALLPTTASSRVLEGETSSDKAPAPATVAAGGSPNSGSWKESGQSSAGGKQAESNTQEAPPPTTATKDLKQPSTGEGEKKGHSEGGAQASAKSPPPPPPVQESPPPSPGASGPNGGGAGNGGTAGEDKGNKGKDEATEKLEVMKKCDALPNCSVREELFACLQVSHNAATESFVIVLNKGQNLITVNVKESPGIEIDIDRRPLQLAKGAYKQMGIKNISPRGGNIALYAEHGDCTLHVSQSVSDLQKQFQQFTEYATRLNPIYGAYLFGFTVVLVGVVCLCCKFARRRGNDGVSYQQLEMSAPAPNSSGADNTISTADGWDDGWDDDWDDEEAPARPPDKKPASSASANGLSLRSHTDSKDGWDVDWDD